MSDPHHDTPLLRAGRDLAQAGMAMILLHGRGATAESILPLGEEIGGNGFALLAPQAANAAWYPNSFLAPIEHNEPWLSSALARVKSVLDVCAEAGIGPERTILAGFSQGACLATEFVARHPASYAALLAFTGGMIGPPETDLHHEGRLDGMTALLSSGDPDPHVPWTRVEASAHELERMGAHVQLLRFPGRSHTILREEITAARSIVNQMQISL